MVPSRHGLETGIIIFAIAFTVFAVMGVAHFTSGAHFGLPSPTYIHTYMHRGDLIAEIFLRKFAQHTKKIQTQCMIYFKIALQQ